MSLLLLLAGAQTVSVPAPGPSPSHVEAVAVELALDGSYDDAVIASAPVGYWRLNEQLASTGARAAVGVGLEGVYTGSSTFGGYGPFPHGGTAVTFNGTTGYVTVGNEPSLAFTGAFSAECWFKTTVGENTAWAPSAWASTAWANGAWATAGLSFYGLMGKSDSSATLGGWRVYLSNGRVEFYGATATAAILFFVQSPLTYNDGEWHHVVCTWDGLVGGSGGGASLLLLLGSATSGAGYAKMYVDGVLVSSSPAAAGTLGTPAHDFVLGAMMALGNTPSAFLAGSMTGPAAYAYELTAATVADHYAAAQWTDITTDVLTSYSIGLEYGTQGRGPLDLLADSGILECSLDNSHLNSAGLAGLYSPHHVNCRSGFTFDIPIRVRVTYEGETHVKFWGRIAMIDPEPGQYRRRVTHLLAHDYQFILSDTDVRIRPQIGQTEPTLIRAVFDALPHTAQPMALDLDAAVDVYPYAFDDQEGGRKAATPISHVLTSAWGHGVTLGDGTFRYVNRQAALTSAVGFTVDDDMVDMESPSDRSQFFNKIHVITHPRLADVAATSVLFRHPTTVFVPVGETVELFGDYRHPTNDALEAAGTDMVSPVSGTDFIANAAADGSGVVLTASVTVVADFLSFTTVKFTLTNNHATLGAYFTTLQARGRGIYTLVPITSEAKVAPAQRLLTVDMPYQSDSNSGQALADLILNERSRIADPVESITVMSDRSVDLTRLVVTSEPGDVVLVSETQTGARDSQGIIRAVRLEIRDNLRVTATIGVSPIRVGRAWVLDDPVLSVLDTTTIPAHG